MASVFQSAVAEALNAQPWYQRRKDTLTSVAGSALHGLNIILALSGEAPAWVNVILLGIAGICQILVHSRTKGAITPSMAKRLEESGMAAFMERPSESGVTVTHPAGEDTSGASLPVYRGESTAGE